jgi:hypothetical protein
VLNKYKNYKEIFTQFAIEAYEIIYKDQIMSFVMSGVSIVGEELETIKRNFIKLCFQLMGNKIEKILIQFYGTRETLISNFLTFFQKKIDDDELAEFVKKNKDSDEMNQK